MKKLILVFLLLFGFSFAEEIYVLTIKVIHRDLVGEGFAIDEETETIIFKIRTDKTYYDNVSKGYGIIKRFTKNMRWGWEITIDGKEIKNDER